MKFKNIYIIIAVSLLFTACGTTACESKDKIDNSIEVNDDKELEKKDVYVLTTINNRSMDLSRNELEFSTTPNMSPNTINLDESIQFQEIDGFGAAVTGSSCYNLLQMKEEDRKKFLVQTFSEEKGYGYSYIRISIGCSDFSLSEYTCCDVEGIENFALQDEEINYVIPILKEILEINPNIKIMGSPWTAPRWMKVNNLKDLQPYNSWTSGHLNPKYYKDYATYFVKWLQAFAENGIEIYSLTMQNEPLNRGNSASMFMGWEEQKEFVKELGPAVKEAGFNAKIYAFDHNYNYDNMSDQKSYPIKIYKDKDAEKYLDGSAYHNYGGNRNELNIIHESAPEKELVFTETSIGTWNDGRNIEKRLIDDMEEVALGTVNNWSRGVIVWNLMLDTDRGPYREGGCKTCYGAVDINASDYKNIIKNSHYYIMAHMSSVVKPGAVRIGTNGLESNNLIYAAFKNVDGGYAFVALNKDSKAQSVTLNDGVNHFSYELPAKSVVSFGW